MIVETAKKIKRLLLWAGLGVILLSITTVLPWRWLNPPFTAFMLQDWWVSGERPQRKWLPLRRISPQLQIAVIASEDQLFPDHYGFDLKMIAEAIEEPASRRRGASTISQQVVKNLYLWRGRSYVRKLVEAWLTVLVETLWPKQRILEVYLNIAEFGRGIYGAGSASERMFKKSAGRLNRKEATLLAAVLPNPKRRRADRPSAYVKQRAEEIELAIQELGSLTYLERF